MIGTLGKKLSSGIFYSVIAKYSGILINLLIGIILARLLSPEEFGIVALVMVFINFFNILSDLGIGPAIIQNKKITNMDVKSIFSVSLLLSLFLGGVFFSLSSVVASFYEKPQLSHITQLLALSVVFFTVKIVPLALHRKKQQFKTIGLVTLIVQSVSGLLAILLAYFGFSYYSLIAKSIFDGFFTFIILFLLNPITPGRVTKSSINKIAKFSIYQFMFNCTSYFSRNSDNLLIGKFIGTVELGFYNRAYQLMMLPIQNLTHVISPVLHPVLSEYQDDEDKIRLTYFKLVK